MLFIIEHTRLLHYCSFLCKLLHIDSYCTFRIYKNWNLLFKINKILVWLFFFKTMSFSSGTTMSFSPSVRAVGCGGGVLGRHRRIIRRIRSFMSLTENESVLLISILFPNRIPLLISLLVVVGFKRSNMTWSGSKQNDRREFRRN